MKTKSCYRCQINKLCGEFVSYLMPYCIKCLEIYDIQTYKPSYRETHKLRLAECSKLYYKNNPHIFRHQAQLRRGRKLKATPTWTSQLQKEQMKCLSKEAVRLERLDGVKRHIDHIVPLVHPLVCGLHLPINLQILTASENLSKSNKFRPYIESEINLKSWEVI